MRRRSTHGDRRGTDGRDISFTRTRHTRFGRPNNSNIISGRRYERERENKKCEKQENRDAVVVERTRHYNTENREFARQGKPALPRGGRRRRHHPSTRRGRAHGRGLSAYRSAAVDWTIHTIFTKGLADGATAAAMVLEIPYSPVSPPVRQLFFTLSTRKPAPDVVWMPRVVE